MKNKDDKDRLHVTNQRRSFLHKREEQLGAERREIGLMEKESEGTSDKSQSI